MSRLISKVRVMVADGQALSCEGIASILEAEDNIEISCLAHTAREVIEKARETKPDLILMDSMMPPTSGMEVSLQLLAEGIQSRVILLTQYESTIDLLGAFRGGTRGLVSKKCASPDLLQAIASVCQGDYIIHILINEEETRDFLRQNEYANGRLCRPRLTRRETELLELVAQGQTTRDIAGRLSLSGKTVLGHRAKLMKKLGFHSQADLMRYAIIKCPVGIGRAARGLSQSQIE